MSIRARGAKRSFASCADILVALSCLAAVSCASPNLSQASADKGIRAFAKSSPYVFTGNMVTCPLSDISKVDTVSQFAETEATAMVTLACAGGKERKLIFKFQRDVNKKWFLTGAELAPGELVFMSDEHIVEAIRRIPRLEVQ